MQINCHPALDAGSHHITRILAFKSVPTRNSEIPDQARDDKCSGVNYEIRTIPPDLRSGALMVFLTPLVGEVPRRGSGGAGGV